MMQGEVLYHLGEFVEAQEHFEQGVALYDSQQHRSDAFLYGNDTGVACLALVATALSSLGYWDQALKRRHEALTRAQELSQPYSLAIALSAAAHVHHSRREGQTAQKRAEALIALSTEQGFPFFLAMGILWQGAALAGQGQGEEGIAQMRQGLAALRATGAEVFRPYFLTLLAEAYGKVGRTAEGLTLLAESLELVDKTGERYWEAELYRLKGQLTLQPQGNSHESKVEKAQECFLKAIEIARKQQAKSLELRAAMSLARLWQQQGNQKEAHDLLSKIYNWFTEGFDTKDLQDAKTLLEELT
jgi:predicted ATPase